MCIRDRPNIVSSYADTAFTLDQMGLAVDLSPYLTEKEKSEMCIRDRQGIALEQALCLHALEDLAGMEHGDPFDLIQAACLMGLSLIHI